MGFLGFLRGLFLAILCFVLVPALLATVIGLNAKEKFFDPSFYISLLEKHNAYEQIKIGLVSSIVESMTVGTEGAQITPEQKTSLKTELTKAIPTSWIKIQLDKALTNGLAYIKSETNTINLTFSLQEIKLGITSAMLKAMNVTPMTNVTFTYPAGCSTIEECMQYCGAPEHFAECQQLMQELEKATTQIAQTLGVPCTNLSECIAFCEDERNKAVCERFWMTLFASDPKTAQRMAEQLQTRIPDTINFAQMMPREMFENLEMARRGVKEFFFYINVLTGATVAIIVLIAIISFDIKSACGKLGWPLTIAGVCLLGLSYFDPAMIKQIMGLPPTPSADPMVVVEPIIFDIIRAFFDIRMQGFVIVVVGIVLIAVSFLLPKKEEKRGEKKE